MPQIPTLPINEPIDLPHAKPALFGASGEAVAELGKEVSQMALGNEAFAGHLIEAERYLKAKQAEIAYDQALNQVHDDLRKAQTPEDAQKVYDHAKGQLQSVLQPFETDRVLSRQLGIFGQQQDVQLQNTVNGRKATLIQKGDELANETLYKKSLQDGINTQVGGGDPSIARDQLRAKLDASVHVMGTMMPQQTEAIMQQYDQDFEKGIVEAGSNSPDPTTRKAMIAQLKSGAGLNHLDKATTNALLTKAENRDRELTNLAESQDYNGAVNRFDELTQGWDYGAKVKALEDGVWLKHNGFVDGSGEPDRKKADMLLEEADRQERRTRQIQTDKDNEVISKYADDADSGKLKAPQIDLLVKEAGGSPKAASTLRTVLRQHIRDARAEYRYGEYIANAGGRAERRNAKETGEHTSADLFKRLSEGGSVDTTKDIWDKVESGDMTVGQARKVESAVKKAQHEDFKSNLNKISNSPYDKQTQGKLSLALTDAVNQQNLQGKAMSDFTDKLLEDHGKEQTTSFIDRLWNTIKFGPAAPPQAAPVRQQPTKIYARDPQGKLHEASPGTALPTGWKLEGK